MLIWVNAYCLTLLANLVGKPLKYLASTNHKNDRESYSVSDGNDLLGELSPC